MRATWVLRGVASVGMRKRVQLEHGFTTEPDGSKSAEVVLEVDGASLLRQYGTRALSSKGKKATACSGAITVRVVGVVSRTP